MRKLVAVAALIIAILVPALKTQAEQAREQARTAPPEPPFFRTSATLVDWDPDPDVQLVRSGPETLVQRLEGVAALEHLQNVRSRNPSAFSKASASLRERGFKATNRIYVERTLRVASNARPMNADGMRLAQDYSESNSEGEILFWSWNDGDDNTWEGEIYVEIYSNNDASTWEGQIDSSNEDHEWIYYQETWQKPREEFQSFKGFLSPRRRVLPAVISPDTAPYLSRLQTAGWLQWADCWRQEVIAGCTGAAIGCIATDGGWPACWGATCVGVEVASAIACY